MDSTASHSVDLQSAINSDPRAVPFRSELSLVPLLEFWTKEAGEPHSVKGALARMVQEQLRAVPELFEPIEDDSVIARHRELIDVLMAMVFPPVSWEQEFGAALVPFRLKSFYATPSFERLMMGPDRVLRGRVYFDEQKVAEVRLLYAYALVLRRVYGIELDIQYPLIFTVSDPDTQLERHFKMHFDYSFLQVTPVGTAPSLSAECRGRVHACLTDPYTLLELLPPDRFLLRGFTIFRAIEVTDHEVLSSLKRDLIEKESIVSSARFAGLQEKLRTLFRRPGLSLGLAAIEGDQVLMLNSGARLEHSCIFADSTHHHVSEFSGSIYERAVKQRQPLIVEDLAALPSRTHVEDELLRMGARNVVVAPLFYQEALIGMLDLASPQPGDLNATHLPKLQEVMPLFSMAVQRSMEELEGRIQAVIKEKCTAIHPRVEWRFRKAVLSSIERLRGAPGPIELEPIVFDQVFPLYGLSDVRGSSTQRALSIQADLLTQLGLARDALRAAHGARPLPALDELAYRVDKYVAAIEVSLRSGDELDVIAFLRNEVEPLFDHLQAFGPGVSEKIEAYRAAIEPRLGTVYQRRQAFEESITRINDTVSSYLDMEEQAAQAMFPHYFERQKTDGVDYSIYVGASLNEDGAFDPLYLRNLRLWQLMVTCGVALRAERLKERLPVPLETAHLILVQHMPLSIRFRFDEKRFDVDGAYNIRYEIIKKRIDKAVVRGGRERLTQPGKIAIVYTQPREAAEYRDYIEYLQHRRYLTPEVEELDLEELQGVQGLRALRVSIELANPKLDERVPLGDLQVERG